MTVHAPYGFPTSGGAGTDDGENEGEDDEADGGTDASAGAT